MKVHAKLVQLKKKFMKMLAISKVRLTVYVIFFCMALILMVVFVAQKNQQIRQKSKAQQSTVINTGDTASFSQVETTGAVTSVDLYVDTKNDEPLYTTEEKGIGAVYEFMRENPTVEKIQDQTPSVQGVQSGQSVNRQTILPKNFDKNSRLVRRLNDRRLPKGFATNVEHYYYNQQVSGVPVLGAVARIDVKDDTKIVGVEGDLLSNDSIVQGQLSDEEATKIALETAKKEFTKSSVQVCTDRTILKSVVNRQLLGLTDKDTSCLTTMVPVCNSSSPITYSTDFYVCSSSRQVVFKNSNVHDVKNRVIYNCGRGCQQARSEGQAPSGDSDVDRSYDIVGQLYDYVFNTYQRDSYDGRGGTINAKVKYTGFSCPNAAWNGREMLACPGMVANDVWGHELFHGVTQYTAGLMYQQQAGALNESFSDIFGYAIDNDDWNMGEDTSLGVIRRLDDPPRGIRPQPDRLFSQSYYCSTGDSGGVHINSGILNKTFYLMTAGGTFNGCTITGMGKDKSLPIMFKALTTYLQPSSNFKDAYDAILKACGDLYGLQNSECLTTKAALQATEMDQQPAGTQGGPKCSGGAGQTPACVGGQPQPTTLPTDQLSPTIPATSPTDVPTDFPQPTISTGFEYVKSISYEDECVSSDATNRKYKRITVECKDGFRFSDNLNDCASTSVLDAEAERLCKLGPPTPTPSQSTSIDLQLKIRLQGVLRAPVRATRIPVLVTLVKNDNSYENTRSVVFSADSRGVWSGTASFDATPGSGYYLLVKGPMHIQKKIGHLTPTEHQPGTYRAQRATLSLSAGTNIVDMSGIVLLVGDLPDQDGVVNSYDISLVRNNLGRRDSQTIALCDVNYDGVCSAQDHSLLIVSLAVKVDEE